MTLLERELSKRARVPSDLANVVTGRIRPRERAMKRIRLIGRGQEFQLECKFHYSELYHTYKVGSSEGPHPADTTGLSGCSHGDF